MLEILSGGATNSVQDLGRTGFVAQGVSRSGAMDSEALRLANLMVGNVENAAAIEINHFPLRVRFHEDTTVACTGALAELLLNEKSHSSWWTGEVQAGDTLSIGLPSKGARAYLAIAGGIEVPLLMGARATELKSGFGGYLGRGLRKGDQLAYSARTFDRKHKQFGLIPKSRVAYFNETHIKVRLIAGAEFEFFTDAAKAALENTSYTLSPDCNRQGYRLQGQALSLIKPLELLSHGIVPGTLQVPPSGQPIIQMAEANTCGGYPKIATVIESDLWRVAQLRPGQSLSFQLIDHQSAVTLLREQEAELLHLSNALFDANQRKS